MLMKFGRSSSFKFLCQDMAVGEEGFDMTGIEEGRVGSVEECCSLGNVLVSNVVVIFFHEGSLYHPSLCNTMSGVEGLGLIDKVQKRDEFIVLFLIDFF